MRKVLVLLLLMMPLMFGCAIKIFAIINKYPAYELISISYDNDNVFVYENTFNQLVVKEFMSDTKDEYRAEVVVSTSAINIKAGRKPMGMFKRYMEVYLPQGFDGELVLTTRGGSIEISGINASKVTARTRSGSLAANGVNAEKVYFYSTSGSIDIKEIMGDLTVENQSGSIDAASVTGETSIKNETGSIFAGMINGKTRVNTKSGAVELEDITGPYITMLTNSGKITGTRLNGQIDLSVGSGSVEMNDITGNGNYIGTSGSMDVNYAELKGDINMETGSGSARLALPKATDFTFSARSIYGSVHSPFSTPTQGVAGQGTYKVNMSSTSGSVRLELY